MSKSLYFCKAVGQNPSRSTYAHRLWDNVTELMETEQIFDEVLQGNRKLAIAGRTDTGEEVCISVDISFDCNADFDYFTSETIVHDGTFLFVREAVERCISRVSCAQTYYKSLGEPKFSDSIKYVIGNFVLLSEYDGEFVPTDKPWMRERTTVLLPIKYMKG